MFCIRQSGILVVLVFSLVVASSNATDICASRVNPHGCDSAVAMLQSNLMLHSMDKQTDGRKDGQIDGRALQEVTVVQDELNLFLAQPTGIVSTVDAVTSVPKIIWIFWMQGWKNVHLPELQKRCLESWQLYNPSWEVRAISKKDISSLLGSFFPRFELLCKSMPGSLAAFSDLLRLLLLAKYGGAWVDATMLARRPLDEWLMDAARSGFFGFSPETRSRSIMSSFLISTPSHPLTKAWLERSVTYWASPRSERKFGYFWVHTLFGETIASEGREFWSKVPKVSAEYGIGPDYFIPYGEKLAPPPSPEILQTVKENDIPMFKLSRRWSVERCGPASALHLLLEDTREKASNYASKFSGP